MNINELPIEVLAEQIFKYFCFSKWLKTLTRVCKHWQQAAIQSNAPKTLFVSNSATVRLQIGRILSKFKVDSLILADMTDSLEIFTATIEASPKLNKLAILKSQITHLSGILFEASTSTWNSKIFVPAIRFNNITTLWIPACNLSLLNLFPNVKYLKLNMDFLREQSDLIAHNLSTYPSIKEVEISISDIDVDLGALVKIFPSVTKIYVYYEEDLEKLSEFHEKWTNLETMGKSLNVTVICRFLHLDEDNDIFDLSAISYWQYANSFQRTGLYVWTKIGDIKQVQMLLETKTNADYERDLNSRDFEFIFPTLIGSNPLKKQTISDIEGDDIKEEIIELLFKYDIISYWEALIKIIESNNTEKTLDLLKLAPKHITEKMPSQLPQLMHNFLIYMEQPTRINDYINSDTLKFLLNFQDEIEQENFSHIYARSKKTIDLTRFMNIINWNAKNSKQKNSATIAFEKNYFNKWDLFVNNGAEVQLEHYGQLDHNLFVADYVIPNGIEKLEFLRSPLLPLIFSAAFPYMVGKSRHYDDSFEFFDQVLKKYNEGLYCYSMPKKRSLFNFVLGKSNMAVELTRKSLLDHLLIDLKVDINHVDEGGRTPLITAIQTCNIQKVQYVLTKGANPNLAGNSYLPIHEVCQTKAQKLFLPTIDLLLQYGADINRVDFDKYGRQMTPLGVAVMECQPNEHIEYLISRGAKTDWTDDAGNTLLHILLWTSQDLDHVQRVIPLLAKYVDINKPNKLNETPIHVAILSAFRNVVIEAFIKAGADIRITGGALNQSCLIMAVNHSITALKKLVKSDILIDLKHKDKLGNSVVHHALNWASPSGLTSLCDNEEFITDCKKYLTPENLSFVIEEIKKFFEDESASKVTLRRFTSHIRLTKFLVEDVGFDVNSQVKHGYRLLSSISIAKNYKDDIVEYLISKGADVDAQNSIGSTPLMSSMSNDILTLELFKYRQALIKHGASVTIKNNKGMAPIDIDPNIEKSYATMLSRSYFDDVRSSPPVEVNLEALRKIALSADNHDNQENLALFGSRKTK